MVPGDDISVRIHASAFVHKERIAVVLPRHLIFARELHTNGFTNRLRQQRRVVCHGVGAVQAITA